MSATCSRQDSSTQASTDTEVAQLVCQTAALKNNTKLHTYACFLGRVYNALLSHIQKSTTTLSAGQTQVYQKSSSLPKVLLILSTAYHIIAFCWGHSNASSLATSKLRAKEALRSWEYRLCLPVSNAVFSNKAVTPQEYRLISSSLPLFFQVS